MRGAFQRVCCLCGCICNDCCQCSGGVAALLPAAWPRTCGGLVYGCNSLHHAGSSHRNAFAKAHNFELVFGLLSLWVLLHLLASWLAVGDALEAV